MAIRAQQKSGKQTGCEHELCPVCSKTTLAMGEMMITHRSDAFPSIFSRTQPDLTNVST